MEKTAITFEAFAKALAELGATPLEDRPWARQSFAKYQRGEVAIFEAGEEKLGRCYSRSKDITLNGDEKDVPKGNFGNYRVLERGEHPLLGAWLKTSCEVDSGG